MHSLIINQPSTHVFFHPKSLFYLRKLITFCNYFFRLFPEVIASILSDSFKRERVFSLRDASDILRDAFSQTEARINNFYEVMCGHFDLVWLTCAHSGLVFNLSFSRHEVLVLFSILNSCIYGWYILLTNFMQGCTATLLLVWADCDDNFYAQCANVGDSACIMRYIYLANSNTWMTCLNFEWVMGRQCDYWAIRNKITWLWWLMLASLSFCVWDSRGSGNFSKWG